ncbi:bifunctional diguanylate cyclase/phosphodiesterase [Humitalea sp. 24SJ18S-53]|uniref:bifunctional diguanylate cyclase/phosphodiesterase n=1 Tax=Humitalea sp. 24SJ18S-53 TaxID=3422307 RepID=UPI003D66E4BB
MPNAQADRRRRRRIRRGAFGIIMLISVAALGAAWSLRQAAIVETEGDLRRLSVMLAEQAARAFQAADLMLQAVVEQVEMTVASAEEGLVPDFSTEVAHMALIRRIANLPQVEAMTILDAAGVSINATRVWPPRRTALGDRMYFRHFLNTDDRRAFVSEAVINRVNGDQTVYLARRLTAADGSFVGVVNAAINLAYFDEVFAAAGFLEGTGVTMARADGAVLKRFPPPPDGTVGEVLTAPGWYATSAAGGGGYLSPGTLDDHGERFVYVRPVPGYGMFVNATRLETAVLWRWQRQVMALAAAVVVASLLTAYLAIVLNRQFTAITRAHRRAVAHSIALRASETRLREKSTALEASETRLTETTQILRTTLEHMNQGILMVDGQGRVAVANRRASHLLDLPPEMFDGRMRFAEIAAFQRTNGEFDNLSPAQRETIGRGETFIDPVTYERRRPNGTTLEIRSVPLPGGGMVRTYTDITARAEAEGMLALAASHDQLTGLANRNGFGQRLDKALLTAQRGGETLSVLCLDLDGFKAVNDTHGHEVGDLLLQRVAACMREVLRDVDLLARMGGDEFSIVLGRTDMERAARVAQRLLDAVRQPHTIAGHRVMVGVSIGIAAYPLDGGTVEQLLRNGDAALYQAKAGGRNRWCAYTSDIGDRERQRMALETDLREAVAKRRFTLAYQPICDVNTTEPVAFEALLRWDHPLRGAVSPGEFIPLAEQTGLIVDLGRWALEAACAEAAAWALPVRVAVNLSPAQFRDPDLLGFVRDVLLRTGLAASRLELELTEGLLLEQNDHVVGVMQALRALGVRMVLDDFGTANSNLSYLRGFPFDAVKIDRSFLRALSSDRQARALVEAMLAMSRALGLDVVGEGVETQEQLTMLRHLRCDRVQGYLLGRPETGEVAREGLWQRASRRGDVARLSASGQNNNALR